TPMTANFSQPTIPTNISADILGKWQDIAATIVSNRVPGNSNGLTALGDTLAGHKWIEAAHVCYLLSRSTSTISGCSNTSSPRLVLVSSANPSKTHNFSKDSDPFIFSEILEYALSFVSTTPGQEPFHGFPHLQSYRLLHAWQLVEMGRDKLAQRYCDAIASTLRTINRGSPFFTLTFLEQLKELTERLVAAPQLEK
ncbi:Sec23-binding domain of Sec16-domain-containing protein, partial [Auriculariales sp. MPI-PUGE-AT-0066]